MTRSQNPQDSSQPDGQPEGAQTPAGGPGYGWAQEGQTAELHIPAESLGPAPQPRQQYAPQGHYSRPAPPAQSGYVRPVATPATVAGASPARAGSGSGLVTLIAVLLLALIAVAAAYSAYRLGVFGNTGKNQPPAQPSVVVVTEIETAEPELEQEPEPELEPAETTRSASVSTTTPQDPEQPPLRPEFRNFQPANEMTSPDFAGVVYQEFIRAYNQQNSTNVTVVAVSPTTGFAYEMQCSGHNVITCKGGDGAAVDIW